MSNQFTNQPKEDILSGSQLLRAIETEPSTRRKRTVVGNMIEDKLHDLALNCLRSFSSALKPLGIEIRGTVDLSVDFSPDPVELLGVLDRIEIGTAVRIHEGE